MVDSLFPEFEDFFHESAGGRLHAKVAGPADGPPVLLLHGFPESALSWRPVALELSTDYRVMCLDLKGYGRSDAPRGDNGRSAYSKRTMAREAIAVMEADGHQSFSVIGHDRGALVAYRMALDEPDRVTRLGILDNLPVFACWELIEADPQALPHWRSLARLGAEAEREITEEFLLDLLRKHTASGTLESFDPQALASYVRDWSDPERKHAYAEDYRAGASVDREQDIVDLRAGRKIACPSAIIWGEVFLGRLAESPLMTWQRSFAPGATGTELPCGHFLLEEQPERTLAAIRHLLSR